MSTIHKAKGKEFDNVMQLLNGFNPHLDEKKRELYVAVTRAMANLGIHYSDTYLNKIRTENCVYIVDGKEYPEVQQVTLLLNHKNVRPGYFKFVQRRLKGLYSGAELSILEHGQGKKEQVIRYSHRFKDILEGWKKKGFSIQKARVNFIVYWKDEVKGMEVKIVLPELVAVK